MIRKGTIDDIDKIYEIYNLAIETKSQPNWKVDVYPCRDTATEGIRRNDLFVKICDDEIVATVILNGFQDEEYKYVKWAEKSEKVLVIHTLVVSPKYQNKKIGKEIVKFAEKYGREQGCEYIRLDTYAGNNIASKLYEKLGYTYRGLVDLSIENFNGLFKAYDKKIKY